MLHTQFHRLSFQKGNLGTKTSPTRCKGQTQALNTITAFRPSVVVLRSVDAALRRSIPAFNKDLKEVQGRLEDIAYKLRIPQRKPWQGMTDNIAASQAIAQQPDKASILTPFYTMHLSLETVLHALYQ